MAYECTKCETKFDNRTCYCQDRTNLEKSFGCPNCKTFYIEKMPEIKNSKKAEKVGFIVVLFVFMVTLYFKLPWYVVAQSIFYGYVAYGLYIRITNGPRKMFIEPVEVKTNV